MKHVENVQRTGVTRTKYASSTLSLILVHSPGRYTHRLTPVSGSCVANIPELHSLCHRTIDAFCAEEKSQDSQTARKASLVYIHRRFCNLTSVQYKVELRVRNHNTLTRMEIIQEVAKCMPENYVVDLDDPDVFVLVEVFKVRGSAFGRNITSDIDACRALVA